MTAMHVCVYSKPDCCLCEEVLQELALLAAEFDIVVVEQDILQDEQLLSRYRNLVPVVEIEGGATLSPPHSRQTLYSALASVRASNHEST
jgi:hypothetical protein